VDKEMENLEKDNLFWMQGWVSSGAPELAITGKKYHGINNLFLSLIAMSENYGDNRWATFRQMEEKGWTFKKEEEGNSLAKGKGASIEYYEMRDKETKKRFDRSVLDGMTASEQQEYTEIANEINPVLREDYKYVIELLHLCGSRDLSVKTFSERYNSVNHEFRLLPLDLLEFLYSVGIIENTWKDKVGRPMHRSIFRNEGDFDRNLQLRIIPAVWNGLTV